MSNLLEQAIIDAAALKEVALKNAEAALIEKYSKEFKDSVEKLLEQEAMPSPAAAPMADPLMGVAGNVGSLGAGATPEETEKVFKSVPSSFLDGDENELIEINFDQLKKEISNAIAPQSPVLSSPEMETGETPEVAPEEIPAEETPVEMNEGVDEAYEQGANSEYKLDALQELGVEEDQLLHPETEREQRIAAGLPVPDEDGEEFEGLELEEEDLEESTIAAAAEKAANAKKVAGQAEADYLKAQADDAKKEEAERAAAAAAGKAAGASEMSVSEDLELTLEELEELEEALKVEIDTSNLSDGHMGSTVKEKREQRNMEFAEARDDQEKERREEELAAMGDLKKNLEEALELGSALAQENDSLNEKVTEMEQNLQELKENIEKLSISNAKLLYINKVLGNISLNERQKDQIVENISKSTSVLEAKTIYNTLQGTVSGVSAKKSSKESLSEALIRGNSPFITRKEVKTDLSFADRMKKLAGITKE